MNIFIENCSLLGKVMITFFPGSERAKGLDGERYSILGSKREEQDSWTGVENRRTETKDK